MTTRALARTGGSLESAPLHLRCRLDREGLGDVRAVVPLLDSDIRGVAVRQEAGRRLFT
ncbi:MAG: hypothetical protein H0U86_10020 [Chloroflexi bacterium]|nr:hypothetical protein [Chloroflexota bacterium]